MTTGPSRKPLSSTQAVPGHLAVAVQTESAGIDRIVERIVATRNDRGDAGADRAFANFEFSLAADQSRVAHFDARDVCDRVEFSGLAVEWNAERAGANRGGRRRRWFGGARACAQSVRTKRQTKILVFIFSERRNRAAIFLQKMIDVNAVAFGERGAFEEEDVFGVELRAAREIVGTGDDRVVDDNILLCMKSCRPVGV